MSLLDEKILDRLILGNRKYADIVRIPTIPETIARLEQQLFSDYELRTLGLGIEGVYELSEEDLASNIHVMGSTREGKSKYMETLIRQNIDRGYGCCLLDPSDNGETAYKVLKYAIKKGYDKVLLIDPHDIDIYDNDSRVPCINPIHYEAPYTVVHGNFMDTTRILWNQVSAAETPRIQKYLPAVITALHAGGYTVPDAECLMDAHSPYFKPQRDKILENPRFKDYNQRMYSHLASALGTRYIKYNAKEYDGYLPTVNRLAPFMDPVMKLILGSKEGVNFQRLLGDGYIVLCNLDPEGVWGKSSLEQRLLGTLVINELIHAASRIRYENAKEDKKAWMGPYYIYIDEVGDYATTTLTYILDKKSKSGFRLCLAHQGVDQVTAIEGSIRRGAKIKVLFNTADRQDRDWMIQMMFGGELSDREVSYHLMDTPKQNCWIKNNKQKPVKVRIDDLPDVQIDSKVFRDFKSRIYSSEFYKSVGQIRAETKQRFAVQTRKAGQVTTQVPDNQARPNEKESPASPDDKRTTGDGSEQPSGTAPPVRPSGSPVFNNLPDSGTVLRDKGRRNPRKQPKGKTPPK